MIHYFHSTVYSPVQLLPCLSFQLSLIRWGPKAFNQLYVCTSWNMSLGIAWSNAASPKRLCSYTSSLQVYEYILERKFTLEDILYILLSIAVVCLSVLIYNYLSFYLTIYTYQPNLHFSNLSMLNYLILILTTLVFIIFFFIHNVRMHAGRFKELTVAWCDFTLYTKESPN